MNRLHELNWYEIWTDGKTYNVYNPYALAGKFNSEIRALEWVANVPDPTLKKDRESIGPIKNARHIAKCLLKERLTQAQETIKNLETILGED